jgi:hypothetical protein
MIRYVCMVVIAIYMFVMPFMNSDLVSALEHSSNNEVKKAVTPDRGKTNAQRPVLTVSPKEIDLGVIGHGEGIKGNFVLKNVGSGDLNWSVNGPEGWSFLDDKKISYVLKNNSDNLRVHVSFLKNGLNSGGLNTEGKNLIQLSFETDNRINIYRKHLSLGSHREMVKLISNGGTRTVFIRFELASGLSEPQIDADPVRMDFGVVRPGESLTKRIKVTNKGRETLRWNVAAQNSADDGISPVAGRYISFLNENIKGSGVYAPPSHLKEFLEITDKLSEYNGYPSSVVPSNAIRYRFFGTGITIFFLLEDDEANMTAYVDEKNSINHDCRTGQKEKAGCLVAEGLPYGSHVLTIINNGGRLVVEGVRVFGKEVKKGNPGWISIFPDSGSTTKENDYVNIMVNTKKLDPGFYGENIIFNSNGGTAIIEVSFEVSADNLPKTIDIYRYARGYDYLYTANPQTEIKILQSKGYIKQGIAYRLFSSGTPGTTPFYRWYNPEKRDHFYSHDMQGEGKSLKGYLYEGLIGNIATSRLTNTRELYRWYNPSTGCHFYSTDPNGEAIIKKGYRFNGIAGYVR